MGIALACASLQCVAIHNLYVAATAIDRTLDFQALGHPRDGRSACGEHVADGRLSKRQPAEPIKIVDFKKQSADSSLDGMDSVAKRSLVGLCEQGDVEPSGEPAD